MIKYLITGISNRTLIYFKTGLVIFYIKYKNNIKLHYFCNSKKYSIDELDNIYNNIIQYNDLFETIDITNEQLKQIIKTGII